MSKNFKIFEIPKNIIPNLENENKWEKFDEECNRRNVDLKHILKQIIDYSNLKIEPNDMKTTVHHIIYNLKYGEYRIENHQDFCYYTLIVYLNRDDNIEDEFYINDVLVEKHIPQIDNFRCTLFWGNSPHHGVINGIGKRQVLCFFFD